jgi:hypothetical protein
MLPGVSYMRLFGLLSATKMEAFRTCGVTARIAALFDRPNGSGKIPRTWPTYHDLRRNFSPDDRSPSSSRMHAGLRFHSCCIVLSSTSNFRTPLIESFFHRVDKGVAMTWTLR